MGLIDSSWDQSRITDFLQRFTSKDKKKNGEDNNIKGAFCSAASYLQDWDLWNS